MIIINLHDIKLTFFKITSVHCLVTSIFRFARPDTVILLVREGTRETVLQ